MGNKLTAGQIEELRRRLFALESALAKEKSWVARIELRAQIADTQGLLTAGHCAEAAA